MPQETSNNIVKKNNVQQKYWLSDLNLKNFCGFEDCHFNFAAPDGTLNPINVFFGSNGCGKSSTLTALNMLGNCGRYFGRSSDLIFRKLTYHPDYDPSLPHFVNHDRYMEMKATFVDESGNPFLAEITSEGVNEINDFDGIRKMEIPALDVVRYIDADHPMNMNKFQISSERVAKFVRMAESIYGYKIEMGSTTVTSTSINFSKNVIKFYQDFVLVKGKTRVHFKRMSDGEKKIATLLRNLCSSIIIDKPGIILVDNIEMHVYFKRHAKMMDTLLAEFPDKQFLVTTHSPYVIDHIKNTYGEHCIFDVPKMKGEDHIN